MNPIEFLQLIKQGQNPQQMMLNLLSQQSSPIGKNLLSLASQGRTGEIEQIARNICASRGANFDKEFIAFKKSLGL